MPRSHLQRLAREILAHWRAGRRQFAKKMLLDTRREQVLLEMRRQRVT